MSLKYRNEQVISSLRTAYTLKHANESWFQEPEIASPRDSGDLESSILGLNLGSDVDLAPSTRSMRSNSATRSSIHHSHEPINTSPLRRTSVSKGSVSPVLDSNSSMDTVPAIVSGGRKSSNNTISGLPTPSESEVSSSPMSVSTHMDIDGPEGAVSDTDLAVSQNAKSLMRWKELGLDLGDDSDFEDTVLQGGNSLTYNARNGNTWKMHSHRLARNRSLRRENTRENANHPSANPGAPSSLKHKSGLVLQTTTPNGGVLSSLGKGNGISAGDSHASIVPTASPSLFTKRSVEETEAPAASNSQLTSMLTSKGDPRDQYLEAVAGLRDGNGKTYKMHIPGREPITITVKPDCSTHLAIGFTLLKADIDNGDANLYTLRLTEDDGEVDEDFPALDRVRPVVSYHSDEFAIIKATESEFRENCKRTPNKVAFKNDTPSTTAQRVFRGAPTPSGSQPTDASGSAGVSTAKDLHSLQIPASRNRSTSPISPTTKVPYGAPSHGPANGQSNGRPFGPPFGYPRTSLGAPLSTESMRSHSSSNNLPQEKVRPFPPPASFVPPPISQMTALSSTSQHPNAFLAPRSSESDKEPTASSNETIRQHHLRPITAKPQRSFTSTLSGTKFESILVRAYMFPYDPLLSPVFWSDDMATRQTKMAEVFEQMCQDKMMDPEMFILRTADTARQQIDLQKPLVEFIHQPQNTGADSASLPAVTPSVGVSGVSSGSGNAAAGSALYVDIEVVALRNVPGAAQTALRPRAGSKPGDSISSINDTSLAGTSVSGSHPSHQYGSGPSTGSFGGASPGKIDSHQNILNDSVLAIQQPFGFYKYPVVRQKVLGGRTRELVIDNENVHIMPPSDRSMVDQPKTTSFHIGQIGRVKQSRKAETNFSISIMKNGNPKTYDLETKSPQTTREIVETLRRMMYVIKQGKV